MNNFGNKNGWEMKMDRLSRQWEKDVTKILGVSKPEVGRLAANRNAFVKNHQICFVQTYKQKKAPWSVETKIIVLPCPHMT